MSEPADEGFNTNAAEVTAKFSKEILKSIDSLKEMVDAMEAAVKRRPPLEAFSPEWAMNVQRHLDSIQNNIGRINGAVSVRSTK